MKEQCDFYKDKDRCVLELGHENGHKIDNFDCDKTTTYQFQQIGKKSAEAVRKAINERNAK